MQNEQLQKVHATIKEGDVILVAEVVDCARCKGTHGETWFAPLNIPIGNYTHWATCPALGQPMLMRVASKFELLLSKVTGGRL